MRETTMTAPGKRIQDLMDEIARLAPRVPDHKLASWLVDGSKPLTVPQAQMVIQRLRAQLPVAEAPARVQAAAAAGPPVSPEASAPPQGRQVPPPMAAFGGLAPGYYATPSLTGSNDYDFWLVERPASGKWEGRTFVRRVLGGPGEGERKPRTVKLENMQQRLAAEAIMKYGPEDAANLFGDELRCCIDCGSPLTDEVSRAERRGPTCRSKPRR